MANGEGEVVCVTGGSGFIGSWLVSSLLERGYTVHATVKDLNDEKETKHLLALEGAESRLRLYQIDLLDYDSIVSAITGAVGVFHLASPCIIDEVKDPEVGSRTPLYFLFFYYYYYWSYVKPEFDFICSKF
ncbi:hypothetical protein H5410_058674 [Solanum commersonii]|uniref:NAD(P)-binding domain-containing protein n=1 Tax=Solanum commersonii TaxID=4109 RepID=A0A9J5WTV6_SOLCO|nr:hypothetical protein H5410_058674 [Solanum commersonii]